MFTFNCITAFAPRCSERMGKKHKRLELLKSKPKKKCCDKPPRKRCKRCPKNAG